jgi:hypothetical protein
MGFASAQPILRAVPKLHLRDLCRQAKKAQEYRLPLSMRFLQQVASSPHERERHAGEHKMLTWISLRSSGLRLLLYRNRECRDLLEVRKVISDYSPMASRRLE